MRRVGWRALRGTGLGGARTLVENARRAAPGILANETCRFPRDLYKVLAGGAH